MTKLLSKKYSGVSDFLINASEKEKFSVFREAARRSNSDQLATVRKAELIRKKANKSK